MLYKPPEKVCHISFWLSYVRWKGESVSDNLADQTGASAACLHTTICPATISCQGRLIYPSWGTRHQRRNIQRPATISCQVSVTRQSDACKEEEHSRHGLRCHHFLPKPSTTQSLRDAAKGGGRTVIPQFSLPPFLGKTESDTKPEGGRTVNS